MSSHVRDIRLENAAPYRALPHHGEKTANDAQLPGIDWASEPRELLGLPARKPLLFPGHRLADTFRRRLDADNDAA